MAKAPRTAWKPGQSGNPGGRPKELRDITALARKHGPAAIEALFKSLGNAKTRVAAAAVLLDRGFGKAPMTIDSNVHLHGGIDAPAVPQTLEEWLARRHAELDALGTADGATARRH